MATTRNRTQYRLQTVYGEGPRTPSNTVLQLVRVDWKIRESADGRELDRSQTSEVLVDGMTPRQAQELVSDITEKLMWMANDSLTWAKQLEAAGVKPEET